MQGRVRENFLVKTTINLIPGAQNNNNYNKSKFNGNHKID